MSLRLQILNIVRWFWNHLFEWVLLGGLYVVGLAILLRGLFDGLEEAGKLDETFYALIALLLLVPLVQWLFEPINRFSVPLPSYRLKGYSKRLVWILSLQELRRPSTYLWLLVQTAIMAWLLSRPGRGIHVILASQLLAQILLYRIRYWLPFAQKFHPRTGAIDLFIAATVHLTLLSLVAGALSWLLVWPEGYSIWSVVGGVAGSVLAASMMCLEGDGGRPWLVNLFSLLAGTFFGLICFQFPWVLAVLLYLYPSMMGYVRGRHRSLEYFDEDVTIP